MSDGGDWQNFRQMGKTLQIIIIAGLDFLFAGVYEKSVTEWYNNLFHTFSQEARLILAHQPFCLLSIVMILSDHVTNTMLLHINQTLCVKM